MKRRVAQGKENKKAHRALHAAFNASPPFMVIVDSTTVRALSGMKGKVPALQELVEKGIEADADIRCVPATRRVAGGLGSNVLAALHGSGVYSVGGTSEDQNEHKAIMAALQAPRTAKFPVVFLMTLSHDLRRLASRVPFTGFVNLAVRERRTHFDPDRLSELISGKAVTSKSEPAAAAAASGITAADAAFMRKLAADRMVKESALPAAVVRPPPTAAAAAPEETPALSKKELAEKVAKEAVREKRKRNDKAKKAHANPLSTKKKAQKLVIKSSKPAD